MTVQPSIDVVCCLSNLKDEYLFVVFVVLTINY